MPNAKKKGVFFAVLVLFAINILRSEEHTSELQSPCNLVCRLLLEKKNIHVRMRRRLGRVERSLTEHRAGVRHRSPDPRGRPGPGPALGPAAVVYVARLHRRSAGVL